MSETAMLLALNAGSSSIKLGLFDVTDGSAVQLGRGALDLQSPALALQLVIGEKHSEVPLLAPRSETLDEVVDAMLAALEETGALVGLRAAAHRVVHGGNHYNAAAVVDDAMLATLETLTPLAPLHEPQSLRLIHALCRLRPTLTQTASFDTAFHAHQDPLARRIALPRALHDEGVQRYGFHGLSYAFIARQLAAQAPALARGRVVAAHLGSGASLCGMLDGRSVDTSMGFSALDGVPMGTRCGALDPGVMLYLMEQRGKSARELEDLLYRQSGLLGVSGISADVRVLRASDDPHAREALALFAFRCAGETARLAASLGGLDALVFTGGIGEHDAAMRRAIAARLGWLGVELDEAANARHAACVSTPQSRVAVFVIGTNEEQTMADEALRLLDGAPRDL